MIRFLNDDDGYLTWLEQHPLAFVLNISVSQKPRAMLHASACSHLKPKNPAHSPTTGEKVGCEVRGELERWAVSKGLIVSACSGCKL